MDSLYQYYEEGESIFEDNKGEVIKKLKNNEFTRIIFLLLFLYLIKTPILWIFDKLNTLLQ